MAWPPAVSPARPHCAGTDENCVRRRPQEAHDEAVGLEPATDLSATRGSDPVERDHAVERRYEVGDDRRPVVTKRDDERSRVSGSELLG